MTIYDQARECLSAKHKHMIYSSHEYKKIIAGLLEAIDARRWQVRACDLPKNEDNRGPRS